MMISANALSTRVGLERVIREQAEDCRGAPLTGTETRCLAAWAGLSCQRSSFSPLGFYRMDGTRIDLDCNPSRDIPQVLPEPTLSVLLTTATGVNLGQFLRRLEGNNIEQQETSSGQDCASFG